MEQSGGDVVSSTALIDLQNNLKNLSSKLHELYEVMNTDMHQLGAEWRDGKYEEFIAGYRPQIIKCEDASQNYKEWCTTVLQDLIDKVKGMENSNVGTDDNCGVRGNAVAPEVSSAPISKAGMFIAGANKLKKDLEKRKIIKKATDDAGGFETPENYRHMLADWLKGRSR